MKIDKRAFAIQELKMLTLYQARLENLNNQLKDWHYRHDKAMDPELVSTINYSDPTGEDAVRFAETKKQIRELDKKIRAVQTALSVLTAIEREIITNCYISKYPPSVTAETMRLNISRTTYFRIKTKALKKMAACF